MNRKPDLSEVIGLPQTAKPRGYASEFPPRTKPGSFNLDRVVEDVSKPQGRGG